MGIRRTAFDREFAYDVDLNGDLVIAENLFCQIDTDSLNVHGGRSAHCNELSPHLRTCVACLRGGDQHPFKTIQFLDRFHHIILHDILGEIINV